MTRPSKQARTDTAAEIPDDWLVGDGWIEGAEQYVVFPLDEHCDALDRDAYGLRWHVHRLTAAQLTEIGLDASTPWVARWGATDDGEYRRAVLCAGETPEDLAETMNAYMQSIVDEWIAGEPARTERLAAWARDWLRVNGYEGSDATE